MRKSASVHVTVHCPKAEEGKRELARRVAGVHAGFVIDTLQRLDCPARQKLALLEAVIAGAKERIRSGMGEP